MKKHITFNQLLEQGRNREDILRGASGLDKVLESAKKINDISLSNSVLKEIEERNKKINSIIEDSSFAHIKRAIEHINVERIKMETFGIDSARKAAAVSIPTYAIDSALKAASISIPNSAIDSVSKAATSYTSLFNSISPISKIYSSELEKIKSTVDRLGINNIINSEAFIEAKKIQSEIVRFEPNIGILPITTLEKSIESNDPAAFERAAKDVSFIEITEQIRVSTSDILPLNRNPAKKNPIDFLIVTGLSFELGIFFNVFEVKHSWYSDKFVPEYYFAEVKSNNRIYSVALACGLEMGNLYASQITNAAIADLSPKVVISAGIGYSLNPNKLQLCDLHITDSILHWGLTSKESDGIGRTVRSALVQVKSRHLFQEAGKYVNGLRTGKTSFKKWKNESEYEQPSVSDSEMDKVLSEIDSHIKCGIPNKIFNKRPNVEVGKTMVSDDAVIASIDEIIKRSNYDVGNENNLSGEMEAAGVAMALANRRSSIEFIAIRGICDFGVGKKELEDSSSDFRRIAATRAATFIKSFIESDPTLPKSERGKLRELGKANT